MIIFWSQTDHCDHVRLPEKATGEPRTQKMNFGGPPRNSNGYHHQIQTGITVIRSPCWLHGNSWKRLKFFSVRRPRQTRYRSKYLYVWCVWCMSGIVVRKRPKEANGSVEPVGSLNAQTFNSQMASNQSKIARQIVCQIAWDNQKWDQKCGKGSTRGQNAGSRPKFSKRSRRDQNVKDIHKTKIR